MRDRRNMKSGKVCPPYTSPRPSDAKPVQSTTADTATFAGIDPDVLLTTRQAAVATGMTESFYEARRAKELPPRFLRLGRCVKYLGRDLIAFLKSEYQTGPGSRGDNE